MMSCTINVLVKKDNVRPKTYHLNEQYLQIKMTKPNQTNKKNTREELEKEMINDTINILNYPDYFKSFIFVYANFFQYNTNRKFWTKLMIIRSDI